jgi:hypothetical protein
MIPAEVPPVIPADELELRRLRAEAERLRTQLVDWEGQCARLSGGPHAAALRCCIRDVRRNVLLERGRARRGGGHG